MKRDEIKKRGPKGHLYLVIQEAKRLGFLSEYEGVFGDYSFRNRAESIRDKVDYITKVDTGLFWKELNPERHEKLLNAAKSALEELKSGEYGIDSAHMINCLFQLSDIPKAPVVSLKEEVVPTEELIKKAEAAEEVRSSKRAVKASEELDNVDLGEDDDSIEVDEEAAASEETDLTGLQEEAL